MKQQIHINDQGELLLIEAPEKPVNDSTFSFQTFMRMQEVYDEALISAIEKGIKFRDQEAVFRLLFNQTQRSVGFNFWKDHLKKDQSFDLPNSYTAEVVEECSNPTHQICDNKCPGCENKRKLAVLTPLKQSGEPGNEANNDEWGFTLDEVLDIMAAYSVCPSDYTVEETRSEFPHQFKGKREHAEKWLKKNFN